MVQYESKMVQYAASMSPVLYSMVQYVSSMGPVVWYSMRLVYVKYCTVCGQYESSVVHYASSMCPLSVHYASSIVQNAASMSTVWMA